MKRDNVQAQHGHFAHDKHGHFARERTQKREYVRFFVVVANNATELMVS